MDGAQPRHLSIIRTSECDDNESGFTVRIALDGEFVAGPLKLSDPFTLPEYADLRWYLERYASQEPFESEKAHKVAASIQYYVGELHSQLQLGGLFEKRDPLVDEDHSLTIDVCESCIRGQESHKSLHAFKWELLEQLVLWSGYFKEVTVRRFSSQVHQEDTTAIAPLIQISDTVNVLVVIARSTEINPTAYQDVRPFAALEVLLAMQRALQQYPEAPQLNVEVVRPGTFDAFKRHLKDSTDSRGPGFYHFVHLDMHGRVVKRRTADGSKVETAWLHFASPESASKPKPVPADTVARLLIEHGIKCAILNACESARADQGSQANLATTFLQKGVSNVLAMSYEFPSSVVDLFFSMFYEKLLRQGLTISAAAAEARKHLKEQALRKGRFGLELQVQDWFIPVSYLSSQDMSFSASRQPNLSTPNLVSPSMVANASLIIGRDYDLLRLEEVISDSRVMLIHGAAGVGKTEFVKYAFDMWKSTQYFDKFSVVDITDRLATNEITSESITSRIAEDLEVPVSFLEAGVLDTDNTVPGWRNAIVLFDGIQEIFNKAFTEGLRPMVETVASLLRKFTSSEFSEGTDRKITFILTSRLGTDWWEDRCPKPLVNPLYFELPGLEFSAAIAFAETILQQNGFSTAKRGSRDLDFLAHIVNLLQRNPLAIKLALPQFNGRQISLEEIFKAVHVGDISMNYRSLTRKLDHSFIIALKTIYERFNEYQDSFCSLADFWVEGPLRLHRYIHDLASYSGIRQVYDMKQMVAVLNEAGAWHVTRDDKVEWLHPLFTLYLRQRRQSHRYRGAPGWAKGIIKATDFLGSVKRAQPFGSTDSLQIEIPRHFVSAVGVLGKTNFMVDMVMSSITGTDATKSAETMRRSLFNVLTLLDMICRPESPIQLQGWPMEYIGCFLPVSRLAVSPPEQEMLTRYVEATLDAFQKKVGGFAVHPELQLFAFNLLVHLLSLSIAEGMGNLDRPAELVTMGLAMIDASEATYGPMKDDILMWKAMIYRSQAVLLLLQKNEADADAAWDKMKAIELEYFGPSSFEDSTFDSSSGTANAQLIAINPMQDLFGGQGGSKFRKMTASWVPVRHAAWPWLKEQVLEREDPQAVNALYMSGMENAFENMLGSQRQAGFSGLEHWKRYFPPRSDLEGYMRRAENREEFLKDLEDGLGRGDWKTAAKAHMELARKAATAMKIEHLVFHLEQLAEILGEEDPGNVMWKQVKAAVQMINLGLETMRRGTVSDEDCMKIVDVMADAGIDIAAAQKAQGIPEEITQMVLDAAERARNPVGSDNEELASAIAAAINKLEPDGESTKV